MLIILDKVSEVFVLNIWSCTMSVIKLFQSFLKWEKVVKTSNFNLFVSALDNAVARKCFIHFMQSKRVLQLNL